MITVIILSTYNMFDSGHELTTLNSRPEAIKRIAHKNVNHYRCLHISHSFEVITEYNYVLKG